MSKKEIEYSVTQLARAIVRLEEAVRQAADDDPLKQDGAIQRFEFTFELLWKTLKRYFDFVGKSPLANPRDILKEAFRQNFFTEEATFLEMLDDRNICAHVYDFDTTRRIFDKIKARYLAAIQGLALLVKEKADAAG
ncbi:MAG: nucleotidyltransferase substrate binding protein [Deltaproteobacteria bacterium]|nr:nucleotidyltransferase substrate binding protein [Deltaproteobacteria bacterium]